VKWQNAQKIVTSLLAGLKQQAGGKKHNETRISLRSIRATWLKLSVVRPRSGLPILGFHLDDAAFGLAGPMSAKNIHKRGIGLELLANGVALVAAERETWLSSSPDRSRHRPQARARLAARIHGDGAECRLSSLTKFFGAEQIADEGLRVPKHRSVKLGNGPDRAQGSQLSRNGLQQLNVSFAFIVSSHGNRDPSNPLVDPFASV